MPCQRHIDGALIIPRAWSGNTIPTAHQCNKSQIPSLSWPNKAGTPLPSNSSPQHLWKPWHSEHSDARGHQTVCYHPDIRMSLVWWRHYMVGLPTMWHPCFISVLSREPIPSSNQHFYFIYHNPEDPSLLQGPACTVLFNFCDLSTISFLQTLFWELRKTSI